MNTEEFMKLVEERRFFDHPAYKLIYPALGLCTEAGEVGDEIKKAFRDDNYPEWHYLKENRKEKIKKELGDTLFYFCCILYDTGLTFHDIMDAWNDKWETELKDKYEKKA